MKTVTVELPDESLRILGEDPHEVGRNMLLAAVLQWFQEGRLSQGQAAEMLGVSQPRISELRRGHIERFTIDALVNMLACAGVCVRISLTRKRRSCERE